ncbi:MAG: tripartite tricarboxylate transporter permease [Phreatobacter sp.]|uniref:tripartite tricarboxylate transporter permease n=1 Tax=Phreatobacter sp. TaxID=1966341 RepID=UPI002735C903|nr:tripartite tricarboxylate transporter permease [Phreatobacter sp.]MDP2800741.1 tripartite tricarboxylate transporter permease [Phreatobacter sp.]
MDLIANLATGFAVALTPANLAFCFLGVLIGTLVGVLPGIAPITTIAILLPFTFTLPPASAMIMLSGIFYGAQYGGSTTAILVNLPGESSSIVTCLDGHQMAKQGRAGPALAIAAIASFFAGTIATIIIAVASVPLSALALKFTAAEYFSLMVLGLTGSIALAHGSAVKAVAMVLLGLLLGLVGIDVNTGLPRMTLGIGELGDGIGFVAIAIGLFGISELMIALSRPQDRTLLSVALSQLWPSRKELKDCLPAMLRGTAIGSILGVLPGGGAALSSFASYAVEKKISATPERFGRGAIEGVAGPEAANNAGAQTSFIPLLTLGIPGNAIMALMVGALMIQGIQPGPQVMTAQPQLFWGVIASMWLGNLMLVILNLPLVGLWVSLLRVPYRILFPAIALFCCIGTYSISNSQMDIGLMLLFALAGVFFVKVGAEPAPFILGFILGPLMEENFRRAMNLSRGDPMVFAERPISAALLVLTALLLVVLILPAVRAKREEVFQE